MHKRPLLSLVVLVATVALAGCAGPEPSDNGTATGPTWSPVPDSTSSPGTEFGQIDKATAGFLTKKASWHVPDGIDVEQTARVGLEIGDGGSTSTVAAEVGRLIPGGRTVELGDVQVGPTMGVTLR